MGTSQKCLGSGTYEAAAADAPGTDALFVASPSRHLNSVASACSLARSACDVTG